MPPSKNTRLPADADDLDEECSEPQSTVRVKAKPPLDQQLDQIVQEWDAGRLTGDEAIEAMIRANSAWAAQFVSPGQRSELEMVLRTIFDTDPNLLRLAGRKG